LGIYKG
jgi:hypothetical protein